MISPTDRQTFRATVAEVAERAKAKLPQAINGRLEKAVRLVLQGDVEPPAADGSITVYSATDPTRRYVLQGPTCTCADFERGQAPGGWCAHRVAAGIAKRASEVLPPAAVEDLRPSEPVTPLPEAPASCNVRVLIAGHEVQWTLRGHVEAEVMERLTALLKRPDVKPVPKPAPKGNWKRNDQGR
jgi:hypothetical protein